MRGTQRESETEIENSERKSQRQKGSEREGRKKEGRRKKAREEEREGGRVREREKEKEFFCQGEKALTMELQGFVCLWQENLVVNGENFFTGGKLLVDSENYTVLIKH